MNEAHDSTRPDTVAIVIPAHRPGPDLVAGISAVENMVPPPDEFVVVVDGGHAGVIEQIGAHRHLVVEQGGPARARNAGAAATSSRIIVFLDSDVVAPADLVTAVRSSMTTGIDAIIGSYDDSPSAPGFVSVFRNLLHHWTHQMAQGPGHTFWGACGAIRRDAFVAAGGFDERYTDATIEDIEFGERLTRAGSVIHVVPSIQVTHRKRWTVASMVHTDFAKRAVPWTRLILRNGALEDDLNTTRAARLGVALSGLLSLAAVAAVVRPSRSAGATVAVLGCAAAWTDRHFLEFLRTRRSLAFAVKATPLMWLHHVVAGAGFAWAVATWPVERRRQRDR